MAPLNDLCKKGSTERWSTVHDHALETMKDKLTNAPVLAPAKFGQPFIVETDASATAIAACLLQKDTEGEAHPIAFASRKLNKHEARYPSVESEALAIVFALKTFAPYLEGAGHSIVRTDNSALTSLMRNKDLTGRLAKYQMTIQHADISIEHRSGRSNNFCDFLSRYPPTPETTTSEEQAHKFRPMASGVWSEISNKAWLFTTENVVGRSKVLGLDLDGTLIRTRSGKSFPEDRDDWELTRPSIPRTLQVHHTAGYKICVFTNQFGLTVGKVNPEDFRQRIQQICAAIGAPMQVFVALDSKHFRKPQTGLWEWLASEENDGVIVDSDKCTFVGDSAGRPWTLQRSADHSDYDRAFAANLGIEFKTPEEFFPKDCPEQCVLAIRDEHAPLTTLQRVRYEQRAVPEYQRIFEALVEERWPNNEQEREKLQEVTRSYQVRGGAIYYVEPDADDALPRLLIPYPLRATIIKEFHEQAIQGSHLGTQKTIAQLKKRVFWPNLARDVADVLRGCVACQRRKVNPAQTAHAPINPIPAPRFPMDRVHTDLVGPLPETDGQHKYMLTAICALTKYLVAVSLKDMKATSVVQALVDHVFTKYGVCSMLVTDNGRQFTSQVFKDFRKLYGFSHVFTTTYHPEGNGQIERAHRTLAAMLSAYTEEQGRNWSTFLQVCTFAANNSIQASTRQTPFFLMHYRDALLPSDLALEVPPKTVLGSGTTFLQDQSTGIREAWQSAQNNISLAQQRQKEFADEYNRARDRDFQPQDLVLIFRDQLPRDRAHKFRLPYEGPFRVIGVDKPNLIVRGLDELSHPFTVHSNKCKFFFQPATLQLRRRELSTYTEAYEHREPGDSNIVAEADSDSDAPEEEDPPARPEGPHPVPEHGLQVNMVRWQTTEDLRRQSPSPPAERSWGPPSVGTNTTVLLQPKEEARPDSTSGKPTEAEPQNRAKSNDRPIWKHATRYAPEGGDDNLLTEHLADFLCGVYRRNDAATLWRDIVASTLTLKSPDGKEVLAQVGVYAKLRDDQPDLYNVEYDDLKPSPVTGMYFEAMYDPILFMDWPVLRASTSPAGKSDQFPVEKIHVWYERDSELGKHRWSRVNCRYPEYSVLDTLAAKRTELGIVDPQAPPLWPPALPGWTPDQGGLAPQPVDAANEVASRASPANAEAGSPSEAFAQRDESEKARAVALAAGLESHPELNEVFGSANSGEVKEPRRRRAWSDMSISSGDDNREKQDAPEPPQEVIVPCKRCGLSHVGEQQCDHASDKQLNCEENEDNSESYYETRSDTPDSYADYCWGTPESPDRESSCGSSATSVLKRASDLKAQAEVILQEATQMNQLTQALVSAHCPSTTNPQPEVHNEVTTKLASITQQLSDARQGLEDVTRDVEQTINPANEEQERPEPGDPETSSESTDDSNIAWLSTMTHKVSELSKEVHNMTQESRMAVQLSRERTEAYRPLEEPEHSVDQPDMPRLSYRARQAVCTHLGIPWGLNMAQHYEKGQPIYVAGAVQPLPFQLIVSAGVILAVEPTPYTYTVMFDAVQGDSAPQTPYNLWQTATVRASELFPRIHGQNAGFVASLFDEDPSRRIGHKSSFKLTLHEGSSIANRGVILQALGLPDHHFRHTTPRFDIGQPVYVTRGSDAARNALRFDPGRVTAVHHGKGPGRSGRYVVKVDSFDQPAVTWNAHIEGYELPFSPEEVYGRRLDCGAVWIPLAYPSPQSQDHEEAANMVVYEEPLWRYLCGRYSFETPQHLVSALYDMTPQRREEISAQLQNLCIIGRFKCMEVRLSCLSIDGTRFARDVPKEGTTGGTVGTFFTEHREDLCHPRWPVIYHWGAADLAGTERDPIAKWPLETVFVLWPKTLCVKEVPARVSVTTFAMNHYGVRELSDVWGRLASADELARFEKILRRRRVTGHFNKLTFHFSHFILQNQPNAEQCLGPVPSTSSLAHFLHVQFQDVAHKNAPVLLNLDHFAEHARDPLGTWPFEKLTVLL